jgi:hypothetical protein
MIKTILTALVVSGMLSFTAQAQTTPAGTAPAGTTAKLVSPTSKTGQGNSNNAAPNRSSTAGVSNAETSNNPVDATGKPVGTTPSNSTSTVKAQKPKK